MEAAWSNTQFQPSLQQDSSYPTNLRLVSGAGSSSSSVAPYSGHARAHSLGSLEPPTKRTRQTWYPNEEARLAAKQLQKARRREQNRNAQRRLRDRKEEHIFKLEGEVSRLRKQQEQQQAVESDLEDMLRRLVAERDELHRRLNLTDHIAPSITFTGRARSSSAHAFLPSLKTEFDEGSASRAFRLSECQRSDVMDDVICESPDEDADTDIEDGSGYPFSALPFARTAEGRMRSMSLQMPKPMMAGQMSIDTWGPASRATPPLLHLDSHTSTSSSRDSVPLSAQSSASGYSASSASMTTSPPSSTKPQAADTMAHVMLIHPARWDGN